MTLVDAPGNLVRFVVQPVQGNDIVGVKTLIEGISFDMLLADKAFDADWLREELGKRGTIAVIPPRNNRKVQFKYDAEIYKWRHLDACSGSRNFRSRGFSDWQTKWVGNYFPKIKELSQIATRYDKTDTSFVANINLVATIIATR